MTSDIPVGAEKSAPFQHALDAITLVSRQRRSGQEHVDFDIYVVGEHRGTWRRKFDSDRYDLYLEVRDRSGAVIWSKNLGGGLTKLDTLKANTADLLVAGKLPTRRDYFEKRAMVLFVDNWKMAAVVVAFGLGAGFCDKERSPQNGWSEAILITLCSSFVGFRKWAQPIPRAAKKETAN